MPHVFLDSFGRPLLVFHALAAFALLGVCTHQAIVAVQLLRGRTGMRRLARIYAQIVGALFPLAFCIGLLMYPHFRYHVRGIFLDRYEPWASNLFDMKENLLAMGAPLALVLFVLRGRLDEREHLRWFAFAALSLWALVLFGSVSGLVITSVRGV